MSSIRTKIDEARAKTGCGLHDIKEGMRLWPTDDPLLAAYYMMAKSHAVVIKGDRDARDRSWARQFKECHDADRKIYFDGKD